MKFRELQVFHTLVAMAFGLFLMLEPESIISFFGMTSGNEISMVSRFLGVEVLAVGLVSWYTKEVKDRTAQMAIIRAFSLASVFGILITLIGILTGVFNLAGRIAGFSFYGIFALGYLFLLVSKPEKS